MHDLYCLAREYERRGRLSDAANLFLKASMNGHLSAMVSYATHLVASDERAAFVWFRAAAERGDPRAWAELGQLLARGRYFEVNAIDAARCWKRAAQMGDNAGKSALGLCYIRGFGVKQDPEKGVEIIRQVADVHNDITAMKNLAWTYRYGKGVPKDLEEAEYWDNRAKKQEKVMAHLSSREAVLFGRARSSKHPKHKPRDSDNIISRPKSRQHAPPAVRTSLDSDHPPPDERPDSKTTVLHEEDLENRLRDVSEDPSRYSPESIEHKTVGSNTTDTADFDSRRLESEVSEEVLHHSSEPDPQAHSSRHESLYADDHDEPLEQPSVEEDLVHGAKAPQLISSYDDDDPYTQESMVRVKSDPAFGVPVADIDVAQKSEDDNDMDETDAFNLTESEIRAVQETAAEKAANQEQIISNTSTRSTSHAFETGDTETASRNTLLGAAAVGAGVSLQKAPSSPGAARTPTPDDAVDEQFTTPDQSLDNDESAGPFSGAAAAVGAAGGAGLAAVTAAGTSIFSRNRKQGDEAEAQIDTSAEVSAVHEEDVSAGNSGLDSGARDPPLANVVAIPLADNPSSEGEDTDSQEQEKEGPTIAPGLRSRARMFDNSGERDEEDGILRPLARGPSYAVGGNIGEAGVEGRSADFAEFEQADIQKASEAGVRSSSDLRPDSPSYAPYPSRGVTTCSITRSAGYGRERNASQMAAMDEPKVSELKDVLALYPRNPMRADSQVPLYRFLSTIQRFPVGNAEAYIVLDEGNGFAKVIVGMISQLEDAALQEQGLHAFVRIIRATQASLRQNLILSSYADCYRSVQGATDAVVPKGSYGIDERASGAIQAIAQAMRSHPPVRRVQLAGCAALGEIASVSSSCRSVAYEYGAISLILGCLRHRSSQAACTVHDIAARATSCFCNGKENFAFKEAFTNAGAIPELLNVLQLWGQCEEFSSELLTTVTKSTCIALRHITDGCTAASVQCVQSFAYHRLVGVMVLRRDDVAVCTLVVSAMTSITRNAGSLSEKGLLDAKPLPEVLITMQAHSDNPLFIRKSLDFMEALGNYNSMKEEIVQAGGIPFAADIIQKGGNDTLLLERACGVVEKLCRSNAKNQDAFGSTNGVQALTSLLRSHQGLPGVAERDLLALTTVCANNSQNQKVALKSGTAEEVVQVLVAYSSKNAKVVSASTSAMSALVVPKNAVAAEAFAQLKAPDLVVRAMKRHPDSVSVQENGSAAISALCEADPRIISMLFKSGLSSVLVVALQRFLHKQSAVVQIVRAMRAITNESNPQDAYRFKSQLLTDRSNESSLSEIFHTALSYHKKTLPDTANVIISICATINRLCMRSVAFKNEMGKDGIVEELKRLVERTSQYRDLGALQPVLATICTLVLESEDNKNRFHAVGGVEAILAVMQKWKNDTYVLEHCCAALRYSCNDHFGNCDEVKNHNGVRSILGVMEMHPENVNVTLWCCLTLSDLCKGDEELQSSPIVVQAIRKVVSAMNMFAANSRFLASACEFLRAVSVDNSDNQERIVRLGGRAAIVKSIETHPGDNTLTESAAYALLQVQDVVDPRESADSGGQQVGLVKRLSRELRRSGSNSSRRSSRSKSRKSLSFSTKRRTTAEDDGAAILSNTVAEETPATRHSLINFSRGSKGRRKGRSSKKEKAEIEELEEVEELGGAEDGYGEFGTNPETGDESDPQLE